MEVLMKSGRYAGELRDVRPDCAKQMIADGRATDPRKSPEHSGVEPGISASGNPLPGISAAPKKKAKR
jgi:hypothetical protein